MGRSGLRGEDNASLSPGRRQGLSRSAGSGCAEATHLPVDSAQFAVSEPHALAGPPSRGVDSGDNAGALYSE
jgi:hypothetical protein